MKIVFGFLLGLILSVSAFALPKGHWSGAGGDGFAYVFTNIGYRLHREFLMEPYSPNIKQARDEMSLPAFLNAVDNTKVIITSEVVVDRHGHEQTAVFFSPSELREIYKLDGKTETEIKRILAELPLGLIVVNNDRFQSELSSQLPVALATVFHEYLRALGMDEDNYRTSASRYNLDFFARVQANSSQLTKRVFNEARATDQLANSKIDLIDNEKLRLKSEIAEDTRDLEVVLVKRRPFVDAMRESYTRLVNAYADVLETVGIAASPFPSASADTVRAMGVAASNGMDTQQKLSELEVINLQAEFLTKNIKRNMDFYGVIDEQRQRLFLELLTKY